MVELVYGEKEHSDWFSERYTDLSRTDFVDLWFRKDILKETFWRYVEIFTLLSDQKFWLNISENGVIEKKKKKSETNIFTVRTSR